MAHRTRRLCLLVVPALALAAACGRQASSPGMPAQPEPPLPITASDGGDSSASEARGPAAPPTGGRSPDAAGAKEAALSFVRLPEALVGMGPEAAAETLEAVTATGADEVAAEVLGRLEAVWEHWPPGTITYRVIPVAIRVAPHGAGYQTDLWCALVVAGRGFPPFDEWATQSYRLVWEGGGWRIAEAKVTPGPRPDSRGQQGSPRGEFEARLGGFEPVA